MIFKKHPNRVIQNDLKTLFELQRSRHSIEKDKPDLQELEGMLETEDLVREFLLPEELPQAFPITCRDKSNFWFNTKALEAIPRYQRLQEEQNPELKRRRLTVCFSCGHGEGNHSSMGAGTCLLYEASSRCQCNKYQPGYIAIKQGMRMPGETAELRKIREQFKEAYSK